MDAQKSVFAPENAAFPRQCLHLEVSARTYKYMSLT